MAVRAPVLASQGGGVTAAGGGTFSSLPRMLITLAKLLRPPCLSPSQWTTPVFTIAFPFSHCPLLYLMPGNRKLTWGYRSTLDLELIKIMVPVVHLCGHPCPVVCVASGASVTCGVPLKVQLTRECRKVEPPPPISQ